jgi:hypothetical protein
MATRKFTEFIVAAATLAWLEELGCAVLHGPAIASGNPIAASLHLYVTCVYT